MSGVRPDKQWLTAAEAAAEALPGFDCSERNILRIIQRLDRSDWRWRKVGKHRMREGYWTAIFRHHPLALTEYTKRHLAAAIEREELPEARRAYRDLKAEARRLIVDAASLFIRENNRPVGEGLAAFCKLYNRRRAGLDPFVYESEPNIAPSALRAWDRTIRNKGHGALIDKRGRPEGTGYIEKDDALRAYIVSQSTARTHLSMPMLKRAIAADLNGRDIPLRTLQAFVARFKAENKGLHTALTAPDKYRNRYQPAFGSRDDAATFINALWEIDATRADAMCRLPDGSHRRVALTAVVDVFTRRAMVLVSDQPRALATAALLRRAILAWGIPAKLKADNGKEFTARAVMRFCADIGIELALCRPFSPEEKPHVERFFGTLNHSLFPMLPAYTGSNVAERKDIEAIKSFAHRYGAEARLYFEAALEPRALQATIDAYLHDIYEREPHGGIKEPPFRRVLAHGAEARRIADERALDLLLFPVPDAGGIRRVTKSGVRVANRFYVAGELGGASTKGDRVLVRLDPHDPAYAVIYDRKGTEFICVARDHAVLTAAERAAIASEASANARRLVGDARKAVANVLRMFPSEGLGNRVLADARQGPDLGPDILPDAKEAMIAADVPRAMIAHAKAAARLDEEKEGPKPIEATPEQVASARELIAELEAKNRPPERKIVQREGYELPIYDRDVEDFLVLEDLAARGTALEPIDAERLREYRASPTMQTGLRIERGMRARAARSAS